MKRILLSIFIIAASVLPSFGQAALPSIMVIINGITSACSVDYTGGGSVKWTYTVGGETYSSTQQGVIPEDGVLYAVEAGGAEYAVYVIDYAAYRIAPGILTWEEDEEVKCQTLYLRPDVEVPEMRYRDRNGTERVLQREFTLTYTDSKWAEADEVSLASTLASLSSLDLSMRCIA